MCSKQGARPIQQKHGKCQLTGCCPQDHYWKVPARSFSPQGSQCERWQCRQSLFSLLPDSGVGSKNVQIALLATVDICNAYRNITMHPHDWWFLGMSWNKDTYTSIQFSPLGSNSAPNIFNSVADALVWSSGMQGTFHYIDDFLILGSPGSHLCVADLSSAFSGAASQFPGIEIDTDALTLRCSAEKLGTLRDINSSWCGCHWCWKAELQSSSSMLLRRCN